MATVLVSENVFVFTENPFLKFFFFPPLFLAVLGCYMFNQSSIDTWKGRF